MSVHIWQYWESQPAAPPYVQLCLETVRRHLGEARHVLLDEDTVEAWLPQLDPSWRRLAETAHRADYIRSRLLERYGGVWLDADAIVLKDLSRLYAEAVDADLLCWVNVEGLIAVNFLAAPVGSRIVQAWAEAQQRVLAAGAARSSGDIEVSWAALGSDLLTQCTEHGVTRFLDPARVAPISWRGAENFLRPAAHALSQVLVAEPDLVMLYNKMLAPQLANVSVGELLFSETLIGALLRIGLQESTVDDEIRRSRRLRARVRARLQGRA